MISLDDEDRIVVIIPHPDDETLGCGGIIQRGLNKNIPMKVIYLTYGDANEWSFIKSSKFKIPTIRPSSVKKMGEKRYQEAIRACETLGLSKQHVIFLGYPDFGTLKIWYKHWNNMEPVKGLLTRSNKVPYDTAYRPGALYRGDEILSDIKEIFTNFKPTKVFTSHRIDYNADHQGLYLFIRVALWDLRNDIQPDLYPFLTHYKTWPQPRGLQPDKELKPLEYFRDEMIWEKFHLSNSEIRIKEEALRQHKTQISATPEYLLSFIRVNEIFGDFKVHLTNKLLKNEIHQEGANYILLDNNTEETNFDNMNEDFLGLDDHSIMITNESIIEKVHMTRNFGREATITFYIFPYRFDTKFKLTPKYRIKIKRRDTEFRDLDKKLDQNLLQVNRNPEKRTLELIFPLSILSKPDIILINVRSEINNRMVDWVPWRIISMRS